MANLASKVQGRVISCSVHIKIEPKEFEGEVGENLDEVWEIGKGLIHESLGVLQMAADREGFKTTIMIRPVIY